MKFLGKDITGPFCTVAGIRTTNPEAILEFATIAPAAVGILTTKCYGPVPREGNPLPIMGQENEHSYFNAVGLSNPGYLEGYQELKDILPLPNGKLLNVQIFGGTIDEFAKVAGKMSDVADFIEVNVSCPHSELVQFGQDAILTMEVTEAVKAAVDKTPVIIKLSPNVADIGEIAKGAFAGGADAIAAINTLGPGYYTDPYDGKKILGNPVGLGGMSGPSIKPIGVASVLQIRKTVPQIPIIGIGGIETARDVQDYADAGASIFGLGTVFRMMDTPKARKYIDLLYKDWTNLKETGNFVDNAGEFVDHAAPGKYHTFEVTDIDTLTPGLKVFYMDKGFESRPGQIAMIRIPGETERPFSIVPLDGVWTFAIKKNGKFTSKLLDETEKGDTWRIRGPYGKAFPLHKEYHIVAGGCGAAPALSLAQTCEGATVYLGAKTETELLFEKEFNYHGKVKIATDDGSKGYKGFVTDLLMAECDKDSIPFGDYFANAAREAAMIKSIDIELGCTSSENIYATVERIWGCGGLGICFKCLGTCVDGPIYTASQLAEKQWWGNYSRDKAGRKVDL